MSELTVSPVRSTLVSGLTNKTPLTARCRALSNAAVKPEAFTSAIANAFREELAI